MSLFASRNHVSGCFQTQSFNGCIQSAKQTIIISLLFQREAKSN